MFHHYHQRQSWRVLLTTQIVPDPLVSTKEKSLIKLMPLILAFMASMLLP
jgi:hypothetical protein